MGHKDWKCINRKYAYRANTPDEVSFIVDRIALSSGHEFDYVYVDCPYEVVYVIGVDDAGQVLIIRQYRYLLKNSVLEVPAGSPDGQETLQQGAVREFEEESGYLAREVLHLGTFFPSAGMTNQKCHIFLASNLVKTKQRLEETEDISVEWVPLKEATQMVYSGKINSVGAAYGILLAHNHLFRP